MEYTFSIWINTRKALMTAIIGLCISSICHAQTYSLAQILDSIEAGNPGLQQYALKSRSNFALGQAARAWAAPMAGVGVNEYPDITSGHIDNGEMPRKMLMLRLEQMFPTFSKQQKEEAYEQSNAQQNLDDRATQKNMLFARAKLAYDDAFAAQKKLTVLYEQQAQLELLIKISEERLAYSKADLPTIYKEKAQLSGLKSMGINLESQTDQAIAVINSLMGRLPDTPLQIDTAWNFAQEAVNILEVDSAYVLTNRSDIKHTSDEINSLELKKKLAASSGKPSFGVAWDQMRMNNGMYMYNAMLSVSIPVVPWSSKGYKSKMTALTFQIAATQKKKENQVLEALGNIRKDWLNLRSATQDLRIFQQEIIPAYGQAYHASLNAFRENTGDIYQTLAAWHDLTRERMEYYDKLNDVLKLQVTLETEMQQD